MRRFGRVALRRALCVVERARRWEPCAIGFWLTLALVTSAGCARIASGATTGQRRRPVAPALSGSVLTTEGVAIAGSSARSPRRVRRAPRAASPPVNRNHTSGVGSGRYGTWATECPTCHTVHTGQTTNVRLIREVVNTPNSGPKRVRFTFDDVVGGTNPGDKAGDFPNRLGYLGDRSGADNAPYDDGICEVCHTKTAHHRNNTSGGDHTHYAAYRCVACHQHSEGFMVNEQDCLSCHSLALGQRRAVARDFARSDSHPLTYDRTALTNPDRNNCLICHQERAGAPNHGDGVVNWTPDPDRSGTAEWKGVYDSWWCVDCHDGETQGVLGSRTAPDKTVYYSSSHVNTPSPGAPVLCGFCHLGDPQYTYQEDYYPFHGNAHAPATNNVAFFSIDPRGPKEARGEENVCFECHGGFTNVRRYDDPGCAAGKSYMENIAAAMRGVAGGKIFRIVSRHYPTDPTDGVNDCRLCHDPHQIDRYANRMIFDPENPTMPWSWSGNGTTPDDFCLRCHDGRRAAAPIHAGVPLGGKRCLGCHTVHGSTNPFLQYLSEDEMAGVSVTVAPVSPAVTVGSSLAFSAAVTGIPADRRINPVWTVTTQSGGSTPREYSSSDGPFSIPDPPAFAEDGGVVSTIVIPDSFAIADLNVWVDASHASAYDLSVILEHVDSGRRILLKADTCFFCGAYSPTWYDEEGTVPGSEQGLERLDTFYGDNAQGMWRLYVTDHWPGDSGTFNGWKLSFNGGVVGTIDQGGLFTAVAAGTAVVRASIHSGRIRLTDPCGSWWNLTETEVGDTTLVTVVAASGMQSRGLHRGSSRGPVWPVRGDDRSRAASPGWVHPDESRTEAMSLSEMERARCSSCHPGELSFKGAR